MAVILNFKDYDCVVSVWNQLLAILKSRLHDIRITTILNLLVRVIRRIQMAVMLSFTDVSYVAYTTFCVEPDGAHFEFE